jgi:hypothetical protein
VHVDRARVAGERVPPHAFEELVAREDEAAMIEQLPEKVELLRGEPDLLFPDMALAAAGVEDEVTVLERPPLAMRTLRAAAAQDRAHASDELTRIERLREVVVGAGVETGDLVEVVVARREHEDRGVAGFADPPAHLHPVEIREHQVENHERRLPRFHEPERLAPAGRREDVEAVLPQVRGDERRDRGLVLDDKDRLGHGVGHRAPRCRVTTPEGSEANRPPSNEYSPSVPGYAAEPWRDAWPKPPA